MAYKGTGIRVRFDVSFPPILAVITTGDGPTFTGPRSRTGSWELHAKYAHEATATRMTRDELKRWDKPRAPIPAPASVQGRRVRSG
jgi:hypothetical protein